MVGKLVAIVIDLSLISIDDHLLLFELSQQLVDQGKRNLDLLSDLATFRITPREQALHDEFFDLSGGEPGLFKGLGLRWKK